MVFLARNVVRVFPVIVLAILKALSISARPVSEDSSNSANARGYSEHVPPIGSDTFNPGTLSHPATIAVDPFEAILDESGLGALDGHDEESSNTDEGEGPLDEIAHLKVRTEKSVAFKA
ncbi:hypothetical protein DEU56DRAFT_769254 [Suillus clintonianus]|uniref:uncharacterized protein n=1 Tax=Suillus clintonianus TaxID=1904413 RepID=UPI001B87BEC9|nr:uncharacterized protein DEU56DRAFT_769254 [Suillus clintonianus]KAG2154578.1 hypothetical protein DEU56DRAFT_769254 [Suillus clintonianus]